MEEDETLLIIAAQKFHNLRFLLEYFLFYIFRCFGSANFKIVDQELSIHPGSVTALLVAVILTPG